MSDYLIGLFAISVGVALAEWRWPRRREQRRFRARLGWDLAFFVFNAHFLGVALDRIARGLVLPRLDRGLARLGVVHLVYRGAADQWPWWLQTIVLLVVFDFLQWCIHRLLHGVPWLWELHKVHHSVLDGEMDFIVSFRFHWAEAAVYKSLQYLPLAFFGFSGTAVLIQALVGTLVGHLNHSNLDLGKGAWRYLLNSPRMHLWHHDADGPAANFGVVLSAWDWIFGTARLPDAAPRRLGFVGDEALPRGFVGQEMWPLQRLLGRR
jgi:sterol desaturase/sphingolipid hydroxylase (fatty acid hydroxylase superfamily)